MNARMLFAVAVGLRARITRALLDVTNTLLSITGTLRTVINLLAFVAPAHHRRTWTMKEQMAHEEMSDLDIDIEAVEEDKVEEGA